MQFTRCALVTAATLSSAGQTLHILEERFPYVSDVRKKAQVYADLRIHDEDHTLAIFIIVWPVQKVIGELLKRPSPMMQTTGRGSSLGRQHPTLQTSFSELQLPQGCTQLLAKALWLYSLEFSKGCYFCQHLMNDSASREISMQKWQTIQSHHYNAHFMLRE